MADLPVPRPTLPMVPKKKGRVGTQPTYSFTDEQWAQLSVCVCCDEKWTSRKSVKGKIAHLKSCAKDSFMSDELVEKKILEELQNSSPHEPKKGAGAKNSTSDSASAVASSGLGTLLEDVVNETGIPKKKTRRPVAGAISVKKPSDTREAIRQRAQMFLDPNARGHTAVPAASTPAFSQHAPLGSSSAVDKAMDQSFDLPSTQILPPSRLALRSAGSRIGGVLLGHDTSLPKPPRPPPSTVGMASFRTVSPTLNDSNESESTIGSDPNPSPFHYFPVNSETSNAANPSKIVSF